MKTKIILLVGFTLCALDGLAQNEKNEESKDKTFYKLSDIRSVTSNGEYSAPVWAPDGKKLLITKIGFKGIYVVNLNDNSIKKLNEVEGAGYNAVWSDDSKSIFFREKKIIANNKSFREVKNIDIETGFLTNKTNLNPDGIASSFSAKRSNDPVVYTNTKSLAIEAQTLDKSKTWVVTKDPGQYYQAILSPDKSKVLVHKGGEMFVYAIDGSGLISSLGRGIACSWSSDNKHILFFLSTDDGHQILGSEIYLSNVDGSQRWQLTNTSDVYEMFPSWSPDNKRITYSDDKSGKIIIANLIKL